MKLYPIIFGPHGGLVAGKGFVARIVIRGRCLLEQTGEDFFSVLGVNPGAVAGDGANMGEAHHDFLENVRLNVYSIADEASDFAELKARVEEFVQATNRPNEERWKAAVQAVRSGQVDLPDVGREDADGEFGVTVDLVIADDPAEKHPPIQPDLNEPAAPEDFRLAAAAGF